MFDSSLGTTNLFLGIIAAVCVLQAVVLVGIAVGAWKMYQQAQAAIADAHRQVEPLVARVNELAETVEGVAADVKDVTSRVASVAEGAEAAMGVAARVVGYSLGGATVARTGLRLYGVARGVRAAYRTFVRHGGNASTSRGG